MKLEMEELQPPSYISTPNWLTEETKNTKWTPQENKIFENALAVYDKDTPDRWHKVAAMIPGKTVGDVMKQYRELEVDVSNIEAGLIPIPGYISSPLTLNWVSGGNGYDGFKQPCGFGGKRSSSSRSVEQERKKGVPWTEEEHKLFLLGLKKYGKGDWRNISRNFVITRTPTQVASHAQKYFIRQLSGGKDKKRASIHDITTVNLNNTRTPSPDNKRSLSSPDLSSLLSQQQQSSGAMATTHFQWNQPNNGTTLTFNSPHSSVYMASPYGINSYGVKMHSQSMHRGSTVHDPNFGPQNMAFELQSAEQFSHG